MKVGDRVYWNEPHGTKHCRLHGTIVKLIPAFNPSDNSMPLVKWDNGSTSFPPSEDLQVLTVLDLILEAVDE